jgi:hypothetical protein
MDLQELKTQEFVIRVIWLCCSKTRSFLHDYVYGIVAIETKEKLHGIGPIPYYEENGE